MEQIIQSITPALSDVPLTVIVVLVVAGIVYRIIASNSKSNDHMYKLLERNTVAFDGLKNSIDANTQAQREIADSTREQTELVRRDVISEIRLTEARLLVAIQGAKDGNKVVLADRVPDADTSVRS